MASVGRDTTDSRPGTEATRSGLEAAEKAEGLTERAREKAGELKRQAEQKAHDVRERARSAVDEQKHAAAGRVEGVARAFRTASDDLREQGQPLIAEYTRYAAEGLDSMARSLDQRSVDDFVEGVEDFARQRPAAFLGGAMIVGFALARFMKSSSARRYRRSSYPGEHSSAAATSTPGTTTPGARSPGTGVPGSGTAGTSRVGGHGRSDPGGL